MTKHVYYDGLTNEIILVTPLYLYSSFTYESSSNNIPFVPIFSNICKLQELIDSNYYFVGDL